MAIEVAFAFRSGIQPSSAFMGPTSYGAGSDGSIFVNDNGAFITYDPMSGTWPALLGDAVVPNMAAFTTCYIAPVSASLCYFIQMINEVATVSQYAATSGITNLPPLPNDVAPAAVSAGGDGTMWVTGADGNPYVYDASSASWSMLTPPAGTLQLISVGSANFILALVTDGDGVNTIQQSVGGAWQALAGAPVGATWVGACLDGSYWTWSGPPTLTLTTGGTTVPFEIPEGAFYAFAAANRYGCWAFDIPGLPMGLQLVAYGIIDAPAVPFPAFTGDEGIAYSAINAQIGITDPNGIRGSYANLDAPIEAYLADVDSMTCPSGVSASDWSTVQKQIATELTYASAVRSLFGNITTLNGQINVLQLAAYDAVVPMVGLPAQPQDQPSTNVNVILGMIFDHLFNAALNAAPPDVSKVINLGLDVFNYAADHIAKQHGVPNRDVAFQIACSQLAQTLSDTAVAMIAAAGTLEATILGDWGKLSACGQAITSNSWYWDPNFDSSVLANIGEATMCDYYQILMPVKWQIAQIFTVGIAGLGNPYLGSVPQYALLYQYSGSPASFWWWVCTAVGADTSPDTQGPFPSQTLLEAVMAVTQASAFFGGADGWDLAGVPCEGYATPPTGLAFSGWVDSASPMSS
jgi:hypothetical protein